MRTSPSSSFARHVAQTPALQENGTSNPAIGGRVKDAPVSFSKFDLPAQSVANDDQSGTRQFVGNIRLPHITRRARDGHTEPFDMDLALVDPGSAHGPFGLIVHIMGTADVDLVDVSGIDDRAQNSAIFSRFIRPEFNGASICSRENTW